MAFNGDGNLNGKDEMVEQKKAREISKVNQISLPKNESWKYVNTCLQGGHNSITDNICALGKRGQNEKIQNVIGEEQVVIDDIEVLDGLDDIDIDDEIGTETENPFANCFNEDGIPENTVDDGEYGLETSNSDDESYLANSADSDTEESVDSEFEVQGSGGSEEDEEDLSPQYYEGALEEVRGDGELEDLGRKPFFSVGMTFIDKQELKRALDNYAISKGVKLKIAKSDTRLIKVVCQKGCPFVLYASVDGQQVGFVIKTLYLKHRCARVYKNPRASVRWLAEIFKEKIQEKPQYKVKEMKEEVQRELKVNVSIYKCKRAKKRIMQDMAGSYKDEFAKLEAYCNELRISNPGSDVSVELSPEALEHGIRVFRRMYICFNACKVGWKEGCRPLIGVDGTFLKGRTKGILLTAVGVDANDSLYPLAFALVEKETGLHWGWFLEMLGLSLDLHDGSIVTFMSDMQKGLAHAVKEVFPAVEHRLCARHIYANWSKKWRGNEFKKKFFACSWSSFEEEFHDNLKCLEAISKHAASVAMTYNPTAWVRAYFTPRCKSWMVDNNISESLNSWIDEYRYLSIIRMIDGIRMKMMTKWANSVNHVTNWMNDYSPKCMELFEANTYLAVNCRVLFNGDMGYEVSEGQNRHIVHISGARCTCRAWDLTGIPCQHAICAMYDAQIDPITHISHYYHKDTYLGSYMMKLQPVRGRQSWDTNKFLPMQPPPVSTLPGRPPKKRKRTEEAERRKKRGVAIQISEGSDNVIQSQQQLHQPEKLSKRGRIQKCSYCRKDGHYMSTCKEAPPSSNPTRKKRSQQLDTPSSSSLPPPQISQPSQPAILCHSAQPFTSPHPLNASLPSSLPSLPKKKGKPSKRFEHGMGMRVDEETGRTVFNPGLRSQVVIVKGTAQEYLQHYSDPQIKFPIPNEKDMRKSRGSSSSATEGSRRIQFTSQVPQPGPLPIILPSLQWRGNPSITTSQILTQRQKLISKIKSTSNQTDI